MDWTDQAIVLSVRPHGESSLLAMLLTHEHGRHAGLVRGGASRRQRGIYQVGNEVSANWRARLADHLGTLTCELVRSRAARLLDDRLRLAGLSAACAVVETVLPERESHPAVHAGLTALLNTLEGSDLWGEAYVRWEIGLLAELGFGLDLSACAATGAVEDLIYVSPRTGRAVSAEAGAPYSEKLLPLPAFLRGEGEGGAVAIRDGLKLTGFFLARAIPAGERGLPAARDRLWDAFAREATKSCDKEGA